MNTVNANTIRQRREANERWQLARLLLLSRAKDKLALKLGRETIAAVESSCTCVLRHKTREAYHAQIVLVHKTTPWHRCKRGKIGEQNKNPFKKIDKTLLIECSEVSKSVALVQQRFWGNMIKVNKISDHLDKSFENMKSILSTRSKNVWRKIKTRV